MLSRLFTFFPQKKNLVGLSREQCAPRSEYTPETFKIKKRADEEFVFSFDGKLVGYPIAFSEAYADQNFCAFTQNNEPGTPSLVFRAQIHPKRILPTARLKGVVLRIPKARMEFLDMIFKNKVDSHRRQTRILLPFKKENGVMLNMPAWMYQDNPRATNAEGLSWYDRFQFDYDMNRGRSHGNFTAAELDYNPRFPHIEKYYIHPWLQRTEGLEEERADAARKAQRNNKPTSTLS